MKQPRRKVNSKTRHDNVIQINFSSSKKRASKRGQKKGQKKRSKGFLRLPLLAHVDFRTPWVIRLLLVVVLLILSMLVL